MRTAFTAITAAALATSFASAGIIVEDFDDGMGNAAYDAALNYDFSSDFTGGGDTHDLFLGELNLWSDLVNISLASPMPGEYIEMVEVTWTDFCGEGCTNLSIYGAMGGFANVGNADIQGSETVMLSSADIGGEQITSFDLSSFEGRIDSIRVFTVPAPGAMALLGLGGLAAARRYRA